jgi:hypothetical protein
MGPEQEGQNSTATENLKDSGSPQPVTQEGYGENTEGQKPNPGDSLESLPEWAQKEIKALRSESAKHRTSNKTLAERLEQFEKGLKGMLGVEDEDDLPPEHKIQIFQEQVQQMEFQNAVLSLGIDYGLSGETMDYFSFLLQKELDSLEEGEELSDERLLEVVQKSKGNSQTPADSSVDKKKTPSPDNSSSVNVEQFSKMNVLEKSKLYSTNPDLYQTLMAEARSKNLL